MEYTNIHWEVKSPVYTMLRKHNCPGCGMRLKPAKLSKVVRTGSAEAAEFDLDITGGPYLNGKVKVIWYEFQCRGCGRLISIDEMKQIEGR